jgi:dienelactone hydrolase
MRSTGYGKLFAAGQRISARDTYNDIDSLFDWIGTQANLDPSRICVTGGSYGGHMIGGLYFYSDRIKCSVDIVGMCESGDIPEHTEGAPERLAVWNTATNATQDARVPEKIAPMNNIEKSRSR